MLEKVSNFFGTAAFSLGAIAVLWVLLVVAGYAIARWCFKQDISWQRIVRWISFAMGAVFACVLLLELLPEKLTAPISAVVVPNLVCAAALHALLLAIDRYMRHRYGEGVIPTRLVVAIITIYAIAIIGAFLLVRMHYLPIMHLFDVAVGYLTRTAIVGLLALEILGGRCQDSHGDDSTSSSSSSGSGYGTGW